MGNITALQQEWHDRYQLDYGETKLAADGKRIISWLLGEEIEKKSEMSAREWLLFEKGISYRYRVLQKYLKQRPSQRFGNLLRRLSQIVTLRQQIQRWISLSRDRRRTVYDVLEEVIQEMLQRDRYLQQELQWIQTCAPARNLREALVCTVLEEYSLRPIQNQPLISYRFVNLMRRYQRSGLTNVPTKQSLKLLSTELETNNSEQTLNLLDNEAIARHQTKEDFWQQDLLRQAVLDEFLNYLAENVKDSLAVPWLKLYLQGKTQEAIAKELDLPIAKSYRLRDKIKYHAIQNFAIKTRPDLVAPWLKTSLKQHQLGLTPQQWQKFQEQLTPEQQQILQTLQESEEGTLNYESPSLLKEWSKIHLIAQKLRG